MSHPEFRTSIGGNAREDDGRPRGATHHIHTTPVPIRGQSCPRMGLKKSASDKLAQENTGNSKTTFGRTVHTTIKSLSENLSEPPQSKPKTGFLDKLQGGKHS